MGRAWFLEQVNEGNLGGNEMTVWAQTGSGLYSKSVKFLKAHGRGLTSKAVTRPQSELPSALGFPSSLR